MQLIIYYFFVPMKDVFLKFSLAFMLQLILIINLLISISLNILQALKEYLNQKFFLTNVQPSLYNCMYIIFNLSRFLLKTAKKGFYNRLLRNYLDINFY